MPQTGSIAVLASPAVFAPEQQRDFGTSAWVWGSARDMENLLTSRTINTRPGKREQTCTALNAPDLETTPAD